MEGATIFRYANDGTNLGVLKYDEAIHEEDLDGTDKLTVTSVANTMKRDRLVWLDAGGAWHEHMVDSTRRVHAGKGARTESTCSNSISELYGVIAQGQSYRMHVDVLLATLLEGTRWTVLAGDDFGIVEFEVYNKPVRQCIAELCELVHGELETVIVVGESGVTARYVRIVRRRGAQSVMRQFSYSRNMESIKREVAADEVYTRVIGYGAKLDPDDDSEYPARLTVTEDSSLDLTAWGVPNGDGTYSHNVTTYTDSQCTSATFLRKQCRSVLASVSRPLVRYEFDVTESQNAMWEDVRLGNLVLCTDDLFNPPMELAERVSHIRRRLSGRTSCRIAIGERANPLVEQFKAQERVTRSYTGNPTQTAARTPVTTGGSYGHELPSGVGTPESVTPYDPENPLLGVEPSSIEVVTMPRRTDYYDGELMNFEGIQVRLVNSDGSTYTDEWHPEGIVELGELDFEPVMADVSTMRDYVIGSFVQGDALTEYIDPPVGFAIGRTFNYWQKTASGTIFHPSATADKDVRGTVNAFKAGSAYNRFVILLASEESFSYVYNNITFQSLGYSHDGKTVQWGAYSLSGGNYVEYGSDTCPTKDLKKNPNVIGSNTYKPLLAWEMVYGESSKSGHVTVKWTRKDGRVLETTLDVTVAPNPFDSGATWGGGGEDQFSSSGGGKF